jgi:hypothetical protein
MSPQQKKPKKVKVTYTEEETRDGYRLNGIVMLTLVFTVLPITVIALVAGVTAGMSVVIGALVGGVVTFFVKRELEHRYRLKHPG